jgi:putative membrane protein
VPDVDPDDELPGLAGERTDLAWNRTGLSLVAILGTLLRSAIVREGPLPYVALAVAVAGASLWALSLRRARQLATTTSAGRASAERRVLAAVTMGTIVLALAGALLPLAPTH